MKKRKHQGSQKDTDIKKLRSEVIDFSFNKSQESDSSVSLSILNTKRNVQNRKEKRKEARLLKKARKQAHGQRKPIPTMEDFNRAKEEIAEEERKELQLQRKRERKKREKKDKKKMKERKKRQMEEKMQRAEEEKDAVKLRDNKEINDLEKKLHLTKRKTKTLPQSFLDEGLDYLLDVVNTDKLEEMANLGEESDLEDEFKERPEEELGDEDLEEFGSDMEDMEGAEEEEEEEEKEEEEEEEEEDFNDGVNDSEEERDESETESVDMEMAEGNDEKKHKWEKLAEKIQEVVKRSTGKSKGIIKDKDVGDESDETLGDSVRVKKKVHFAEEPEVYKSGDSEGSSNLEHTDSDSVNSGESNEDLDQMEDTADIIQEGEDGDIDDFTGGGELDEGDSELKEDIYGRLRDSQGNIVKDNKGVGGGGGTGAYVPPAKRAQMIAGTDEKRKVNLEKLRKQMKGLVNRASEANIQNVSSQIEELYLSNSRADVNETLVSLVFDLCVTTVLTPERLSMELMMLVAILHGNVGSEVGAHFLQSLVKKFDTLTKGEGHSGAKELDNVVVLLSHLYNFRVVHSVLMFDLLKLLTDRFQGKDVELLLLIVKNIGFSLRKDAPSGLKEWIVSVQSKAASPEVTAMRDQSRVAFMLDVLMAIRNNNMRKIPNYDPEHLHHLQKMMKGFLRGGEFGDNQLHVTLQDLINAENKGKWWIVGSAWEGQGPKQPLKDISTDSSSVLHGIEISSRLQELAKKQRMNTDKRRTIFYVIMTSEDYIDAFEKLLRMGLKANQQQEIVVVILDCCLQEKTYNPFYAVLAQKFCEHHRSYQMSFQFSIWDRFKAVSELSESNRTNFGKLLTYLLIQKSLSLSILKQIEFGTVGKSMVRLLKQVLTELLLEHPVEKTEAVFARIAPLVKLKKLHEGLKLFMHHFLLGKKKDRLEVSPLLKERVEMVEKVLSVSKGHML